MEERVRVFAENTLLAGSLVRDAEVSVDDSVDLSESEAKEWLRAARSVRNKTPHDLFMIRAGMNVLAELERLHFNSKAEGREGEGMRARAISRKVAEVLAEAEGKLESLYYEVGCFEAGDKPTRSVPSSLTARNRAEECRVLGRLVSVQRGVNALRGLWGNVLAELERLHFNSKAEGREKE